MSIECRKQGRSSIPFVVVSHGSATPLLERQTGLSPIQSLNLAFLIGAEYDGVFRRVQIQPHDRLQLFNELRIVAELECPHQMRLEAVGMPNAADAGFTQPHSGGHRPGAPVLSLIHISEPTRLGMIS